jgi:hypothetical protein
LDRRYDAYILYNSRERDLVEPVYKALVARDIKAYFDVKDLPPGDPWQEYEEQILSANPVVVLFLGPVGWGPNHRKLAIELNLRKFKIIPVLLAEVDEKTLNDAGEIFRRLRYIFLPNPEPQAIDALAESIRDRIKDQAAPPPPTGSHQDPAPHPGTSEDALSIEIHPRVLSDSSQSDLLGFSDYADALADLIKNDQTEKPITIGVEAPWGMGKTRLMRMIRERLYTVDAKGRRTDLPTVWFDAWKYDKEESLWAALALEVMAQTRRRLSVGKWIGVWFRVNLRRLDYALIARTILNAVIYFVLFGALLLLAYPIVTANLGKVVALKYLQTAGVLGFIAGAAKVVYEIHKRLAIPFDEKIARYVKQPKYEERVGFIGRFQDDFKEIVAVITGSAATPLVIFIDDLDRCSPVKAVEVLEAINLLLDSERCVFVIGMDAKAVAASIEAKYKDIVALTQPSDDLGGLTLGQRFLEKILQIEFRLPPPTNEYMAGYVDSILGGKSQTAAPAVADQQQAAAAKEVLAQEEQKGKSLDEAARSRRLAEMPEQVVKEAKVQRFAESFDGYEVVRGAVRSASLLLGNNPRKVKRFVNAFRLQALIANRRRLLEGKVIDLDLLAKWLVAETRWPELMSDVLDEPALLERAAAARNLAQNYRQNWSDDNLRHFQVATEDPRVKRLAEAAEATPFIEELRRRAGDRLQDYLHLGKIIGEAKSQAAGAA